MEIMVGLLEEEGVIILMYLVVYTLILEMDIQLVNKNLEEEEEEVIPTYIISLDRHIKMV